MYRVSVIISAYNSEKCISRAIESLLAQSFDRWECIIYDDASEDKTWDIIDHYKQEHPNKFTCIKNSYQNKGPAYGRNRCLDLARGEYVAIQDADDISLPERLARQVEFLDEKKDVSAVGTYATFFDEREENWGINKPPCEPSIEDWMKGAQVIHASTLIRKEHLIAVGKYNENLRRVEDYDLWLRMISRGYTIKTIPMVLYKIRADATDYKRRTFKYRWEEFKIKYLFLKQMHLPFPNYIYLATPFIKGLIPPKITYLYHKQKFGRNLNPP